MSKKLLSYKSKIQRSMIKTILFPILICLILSITISFFVQLIGVEKELDKGKELVTEVFDTFYAETETALNEAGDNVNSDLSLSECLDEMEKELAAYSLYTDFFIPKFIIYTEEGYRCGSGYGSTNDDLFLPEEIFYLQEDFFPELNEETVLDSTIVYDSSQDEIVISYYVGRAYSYQNQTIYVAVTILKDSLKILSNMIHWNYNLLVMAKDVEFWALFSGGLFDGVMLYDTIIARDEAGQYGKFYSDDKMISWSRSSTGNLYVVCSYNIKSFISDYITISMASLILMLIAVITSSIFTRKASANQSKMITDIQKGLNAILNGENISISMDKTLDSIRISELFNSTSNLLHTTLDQAKEAAVAKSISEYKFLVAQFNPHFIYNTLEQIRSLIDSQPAAAKQSLISFAELLRHSVNGESLCPVKRSIDVLHEYIKIMSYRFEMRLKLRINAERSTYKYKIPKLILQPIVENAVKYNTDMESLTIELNIFFENHHLILQVKNNGSKIPEEQIVEINNNIKDASEVDKHLGLRNIYRKLQIIYNNHMDMIMTNNVDEEGLAVTIQIEEEALEC